MESRPGRVLLIADTVGGVWNYALEISQFLISQHIHVGLATMGRALDTQQKHDLALLPEICHFPSEYKLEWMSDPWKDIALAGEWLLDVAEGFRPDLVHINTYCHANLPWNKPVVCVAHSCVSSWWQAVHQSQPPPEWDQYRAGVKQGLRAAEIVIAPSRAMLKAVQEQYGPLPNVRVIYNARSVRSRKAQRKEPFVLCVGRLWDEAKNIQLLAKVAPKLDWPVFVAGEEGIEGKAVAFNGLQSQGKLGPDDLRSLMSRASIYASPALYEPFGLSVLEAAQEGCALVLGDIPSLREIWGEAALFVPASSQEPLIGALNQLSRDPQTCALWGERARLRANTFDPDCMGHAYLSAYHDAGLVRAMRKLPDFVSLARVNDGPVPIRTERTPCES